MARSGFLPVENRTAIEVNPKQWAAVAKAGNIKIQ
jgi:hypothetical protein